MSRLLRALAAAGVLLLPAPWRSPALAEEAPASRPAAGTTSPPAERAASAAPADPLLLGEHALEPDPVVDGDTIRLAPRGRAPSVRILALDAEELFHGSRTEVARDRAAAERDFAAYAAGKRAGSPSPVKYGTPEGEAARDFAREAFRGVARVRLERDEVGRDTDGYGRLLAHVFFEKDGREVLYAEAAIRAGHSPYFTKYGRSLRFDARFVAAQEEARRAKRGIWAEGGPHYPDYAERLAWWEERAKQVEEWARLAAAPPEGAVLARLGVPAETAALRRRVGERATVFGSLDRADADSSPKALLFSDAPHAPLRVVVPDDAVWNALDLGAASRRFCRVTGVVTEARGRLRLTLSSPTDISTR
jgi:endonuclease YncB( thermonuclease family)